MRMIDIGKKPTIFREATAEGTIKLKPNTLKLIRDSKIEKGNVYDFSKIAGIMAAKKTSELIPLCHTLQLSTVDVSIDVESNSTVTVKATVRANAKTGVEMEALTAVSMALLTIWDMTKQYEKDQEGQYPTTVVNRIRVLTKVKHIE